MSSKNNTSLGNQSDKYIKKLKEKEIKITQISWKNKRKRKIINRIRKKLNLNTDLGCGCQRGNAVVGDSMLNESRILKTHLVKGRLFWAALIKDMHYYLIPVLEKTSALSILHIEAKDVGDSSH